MKNISHNISAILFDIKFLYRKLTAIVEDTTPDAIIAKQKISLLIVFIKTASLLFEIVPEPILSRKESETSEHT